MTERMPPMELPGLLRDEEQLLWFEATGLTPGHRVVFRLAETTSSIHQKLSCPGNWPEPHFAVAAPTPECWSGK